MSHMSCSKRSNSSQDRKSFGEFDVTKKKKINQSNIIGTLRIGDENFPLYEKSVVTKWNRVGLI